MPQITQSPFARNLIAAGLASHITAIFVAMMPAAGAESFFSIVFPLSCLALTAGAYTECQFRGRPPFGMWRFYLIGALTVFPVFGPLAALGLLSRVRVDDSKAPRDGAGLFSAILKFKVNLAVMVFLFVVLFLVFAFFHRQKDQYFKKRAADTTFTVKQ